MKRKQKILASVITTLLGGSALSMSAAAIIDITGTTTTVQNMATYASEIKASSTLQYTLPVIKVNLGGGVGSDAVAIPAGETRYVRVDLQNATLTGTPFLAGWTAASGGLTANNQIAAGDCPTLTAQGQTSVTTAPAGNVQTAQAGGNNDSYVIFSVKSGATDTGGIYSAGCTIGIDLHSIKVTTPGQPVYLTYALYSGPIAAANATIADTRGMNKQKVQVVGFAPALSFKSTNDGKDAIASVEQQFRLFKKTASNSSADGKSASAGAFELTTNANVLPATGGTPISSPSIILGSGTKLKVEGDFTSIWASGTSATPTLSYDIKCGTPITTGTWEKNTAGVPIAATFSSVTSLTGTTFFCLTLGEKNPSPISSSAVQIASTADNFKLTLLSSGNEMTGYEVANKQIDLKKITRDGVTLESPFINIAPGYTSRVVLAHLNAKASDDVPYFITLRSDEGNVFTQKVKEGVLKKGTTAKIMSTDLFSTATGAKTRVGVTVTFYGQNDDIQGVVQHINSVSGEVTSIPMTRPGGGRNED